MSLRHPVLQSCDSQDSSANLTRTLYIFLDGSQLDGLDIDSFLYSHIGIVFHCNSNSLIGIVCLSVSLSLEK